MFYVRSVVELDRATFLDVPSVRSGSNKELRTATFHRAVND